MFVDQDDSLIEAFLSSIGNTQVQVIGPELIFGKLYDKIGFNQIEEDIFRHIVLARLYHPGSKLKTIDYLQRFLNVKKLLKSNGYEYIIGARIKNESAIIKQKILNKEWKNGRVINIDKNECERIIVSFSESRAKKDAANRHRGLIRLEKNVKSGNITKSNINNRGYNKYLKMDGKIKIEIDYDKYNADASWDGLKGYLTNTKLKNDEVIDNYNNLWQIEKAF